MTLLLLPLPCPIHVVAVDDGGVVVTLVLKIIFFVSYCDDDAKKV